MSDDAKESGAPAAPPPSRSGLGGILGLVDEGVFRVERALVTLAALVMTTTVFLDIVYRSFAADESKLAEKLLTPLGLFGVERNADNYGFLRDKIVPLVLIGTAFLAGWAVYGASCRRREVPKKPALSAAWGTGFVVVSYAVVEFVVRVPSRWVCATILLAGCAWWAYDAVKTKVYFNVVLAAVTAGLGFMVCKTLPQNYIWSQELSLILLAWMAFIGGSMATRMVKHIQVDALGKLIPKALRPWTRALGLLVAALFTAYLTALAYEHVFGPKGDFNSGEIRPATRMPAWVIVFSVVVSFGMTTLRFFAQAVDAVLNPREAKQELTH